MIPEVEDIKRLVIAGASEVAIQLAVAARAAGLEVSVVVGSQDGADRMVEAVDSEATVICGKRTDASVLEEAGWDHADAFVAAGRNNESNVLACVLARRMGEGKFVKCTRKRDARLCLPSN